MALVLRLYQGSYLDGLERFVRISGDLLGPQLLSEVRGVRGIISESQRQSQRLLRSSLPAADLTAEMETMAQRHVSMDD